MEAAKDAKTESPFRSSCLGWSTLGGVALEMRPFRGPVHVFPITMVD